MDLHFARAAVKMKGRMHYSHSQGSRLWVVIGQRQLHVLGHCDGMVTLLHTISQQHKNCQGAQNHTRAVIQVNYIMSQSISHCTDSFVIISLAVVCPFQYHAIMCKLAPTTGPEEVDVVDLC